LIAFPFTEATPIQFPGPLPEASDVVIIGGGIIGVTTALFLARRNISVTLLEKGRVAAEQSSRNWGWIRQQGRDADELPIMIEAHRLWQQLAEECGEDIGLRQTGVTYLARTDKEMDDFVRFLKIAEVHGVRTAFQFNEPPADHAMRARSRAVDHSLDMRAAWWPFTRLRHGRREGLSMSSIARRACSTSCRADRRRWTVRGRSQLERPCRHGAWTRSSIRAMVFRFRNSA